MITANDDRRLEFARTHHFVEDTPVTLREIQLEFGEKIAKIVDGLTKLDGLYNVESPQAENFKKVLSTLVDDVRVILIKMADRLHNLRTIDAMSRHKQIKIAAETSYIYAPLAHRLGLYNLKSEFMDICLKINEPELYTSITTKLKGYQNNQHDNTSQPTLRKNKRAAKPTHVSRHTIAAHLFLPQRPMPTHHPKKQDHKQ